MRIGAWVSILLIACAQCAAAKAVIREIDYKGWSGSCEISNSLVRAVVVPRIGGRIMEYSLAGKNVIWQNPDELGVFRPSDTGVKWHNYGGYKAWNAPQARWRNPDNDNFYDYAPAEVEIIENPPQGMIGVRVKCAPITHLGVRFVRDVLLSERSSHLRVIEKMRNVSSDSIDWSIWEVTQVNAPCSIAFPLRKTQDAPAGWIRLMGPEYPDPQQVTTRSGIGVLTYSPAINKIGTTSPDGWMAYLADAVAYVKRWMVTATPERYSDAGCNSQVFTADKSMGGYLEMEVMSPMTSLAPGEETTLTEDWYLVRTDESIACAEDAVSTVEKLRANGFIPRPR